MGAGGVQWVVGLGVEEFLVELDELAGVAVDGDLLVELFGFDGGLHFF